MVPVIDFSEDLSKVLNYNEEKVQRGAAEIIDAGNFLKPAQKLTWSEKYSRFQSLNELRDTVNLNMLHLSLNFHPDDHLSKETLREIASLYMDRIGMANQPYLVYEHFDAGHPHIHIVSNLIRPNGSRVPTHNMGKIPSVMARKEIDQLYSLRRVEDSQHVKIYEPEPLNAQKVLYGKSETKKCIKDVLRFVLKRYRFASIPEFNAILQQYNVMADRGTRGSRIFQNGGLVYRVLDGGKPIGVPIKASDFYFKPTLKTLQELFPKNLNARKTDLPDIRSKVDWITRKRPKTFQGWSNLLKSEGIQVVPYRTLEGKIYGLTYIDYKTKTVITGSDLGKAYSASSILRFLAADNGDSSKENSLVRIATEKPRSRLPVQRISKEASDTTKRASQPREKNTGSNPDAKRSKNRVSSPDSKPVTKANTASPFNIPTTSYGEQGPSLVQSLLSEIPADQIPFELTTEKKKKRKKKINH